MKIKNKRKPYSIPESSSLVMEGRESLLGGSVVTDKTIIMSTGQEIGAVYDFSADNIAEDGGTVFNQDWESGPGAFTK